jgi:hypothetical protein
MAATGGSTPIWDREWTVCAVKEVVVAMDLRKSSEVLVPFEQGQAE